MYNTLLLYHIFTTSLSLHTLQMPFNCESFHELLEAVIQATEESDFKPVYVAIVARFFNSFADITKRDGYIVEDHVSPYTI